MCCTGMAVEECINTFLTSYGLWETFGPDCARIAYYRTVGKFKASPLT
jgi:hypothetical protein